LNVNKSRSEGGEAYLALRPIQQLFLSAAVNYDDARQQSGLAATVTDSTKPHINRVPSPKQTVRATYSSANYGDWTAYSWNALSVFDRNRANAANNIPHMFQLGYMYEVPFGSGKKWASKGVSRLVLGDWQINGIFGAYQGRQYTLSASGTSLNMPGNAQTPDQVNPVVAKLGKVGDDGTWFDTTAFARPTGPRFGTVGRNTMLGPGVVNMDLSLFRTFKFTERVNLRFQAESFNLSNTPHFANPNSNANAATFGRITSTQSGGDAIGRSRELRFGLRLGF